MFHGNSTTSSSALRRNYQKIKEEKKDMKFHGIQRLLQPSVKANEQASVRLTHIRSAGIRMKA